MQRIELLKASFAINVANNLWASTENKRLLKNIKNNSSVIELRGMGAISELLSKKNKVALCEEDRLAMQERKRLLPDSSVTLLGIDPVSLKVTNPPYDYVVVNDKKDLALATELAKVGIVDLVNQEYISVESSQDGDDKSPDSNEEVIEPTSADKQPESENTTDPKDVVESKSAGSSKPVSIETNEKPIKSTNSRNADSKSVGHME